MHNTSSLRRRLLIWLLLPLLPLMLAYAWWTYLRAVDVANEAHDRALYLATRTLAEELYWERGQLRLDVLRGAGYLFENHTGARLFYRIDDSAGQLLAGQGDLPKVAASDTSPVRYFSLVQYADGTYQDRPVRLIRLIHVVNSTPSAAISLEMTVAETREVREQLIAQVLRETLLGQALWMAVVLVLVWWGVQRGLRPIDAYREHLTKRADDDFSAIELPQVPRELRPLFEALNGYLVRLGRLIDIRKRFIDNAAHQLRTPLTVLKTQLALASRGAVSETSREHLLAASKTTNDAVQLTEQLLALTRAEHASEMHEAQSVDLVLLAHSVTQECLLRAHSQHADLGFESAVDSVQIQGVHPMLHEAIANLIDNALTHGGPRARITVRAGPLWVEVEDDGPGIAPEHQAHVFERFYRVPGNTQPGSGLGLAIVREIAQQHGAGLSLHSPAAAGRGTRIRMSWPPLH